MLTSYPPTTLYTTRQYANLYFSAFGLETENVQSPHCSPIVLYIITVILYLYTYMYFCYKFNSLDFNGKDTV